MGFKRYISRRIQTFILIIFNFDPTVPPKELWEMYIAPFMLAMVLWDALGRKGVIGPKSSRDLLGHIGI